MQLFSRFSNIFGNAGMQPKAGVIVERKNSI